MRGKKSLKQQQENVLLPRRRKSRGQKIKKEEEEVFPHHAHTICGVFTSEFSSSSSTPIDSRILLLKD